MKMFGALLIFAAAGLFGLERVNRLKRHAADLQMLKETMAALYAGVKFRRMPLENLLRQENAFCRRWRAECAHASIEEACLQAAEGLVLHAEERRVLQAFAGEIGRLGAGEQLVSLELCRNRLETYVQKATAELQQKAGVQLTVCLCMGGVVGLLLL